MRIPGLLPIIPLAMTAYAASPLFAAQAQSSVGMIAQVQGKARWTGARSGAPEPADDIRSGDSLRMEAGATVVLMYFADCREESISGKAEIAIGKKASRVKGTVPQTRTIRCEPPGTLHDTEAGAQPAALVLMGPKKKRDEKKAGPEQLFLDALQQDPKDASTRLAYALFLENSLQLEKAAEQYKELSSGQAASETLTLRRNTSIAARALQSLEQGLKRCAASRGCDEQQEAKQRADILREAGVKDAAVIDKAQVVMRRRMERALELKGKLDLGIDPQENSDREELLGCFSGPRGGSGSPAVMPARLAEIYSQVVR